MFVPLSPSCVARLHIKQTADATVYPTVTASLHEKLVTQVTSQDEMCLVGNLNKYTDLTELTPIYALWFFYRKIWDTKVADPSTR